MRAFKGGLRQILTVSKSELARREQQYQTERATKPNAALSRIFGFGPRFR